MDKTKNAAKIQCTVCLEDFQATINFLSEAIDVYNEWIDACEAANNSQEVAEMMGRCMLGGPVCVQLGDSIFGVTAFTITCFDNQ